MEIYTSAEDAANLIKERWNNKLLQKKVAEKIKDKIPLLLADGPIGIIGRNIATPDGEFSRFIELNKRVGTRPVVFEYANDKFVAKNISKYSLVNMPFNTGKLKDSYGGAVKIKIINFNKAEGKNISTLQTLWGEDLVSFHHKILFKFFPEVKNSIIDMSEVFKDGFDPKEYYTLIFSLAICHSIYFEDFFSFDNENDFVKDVVLPAFTEVQKSFDLKPIIVRISTTDDEYRASPHCMFYSKEMKDLVEKNLKNFK